MQQEYPYSSIFDYDEYVKEEQAKKDQSDAAQRKIMKTNAIGDAFRLLFDTVGAGKNATVVPKAVNPGIMGASNELLRSNSEFGTRKDRIRLTEIAAKQRDMDNQVAWDRESDGGSQN